MRHIFPGDSIIFPARRRIKTARMIVIFMPPMSSKNRPSDWQTFLHACSNVPKSQWTTLSQKITIFAGIVRELTIFFPKGQPKFQIFAPYKHMM
jgi:hypothetical protein